MTERDRSPRRTFVRRFGAAAASVGAVLGGMVPELRAQTLLNTPPPESPLALDEQNALYVAALGSPDVTALIGALGQPLRVDPPARGYSAQVASGQRVAYVEIALTSYATGLPVAYLLFGTASVTDQQGATQSLPLRLTIAADASMRIALAGIAYDAPSPSSVPGARDLLFASYFLEQYMATLDAEVGGPPAARRTSQAASLVRKVMMADSDGALEECRRQLRACARGPAWPCIGGWSSLLLCTVAAIAGCAPTPIWGITCWSAITICTATAIAISVCTTALQNCSNRYKKCRRNALLDGGGGVRT